MVDDITIGLLANVTMTAMTLAVGHGQMYLGYLMMSQKVSHIWVSIDITIRTATLTVQHQCMGGSIASLHRPDCGNQVCLWSQTSVPSGMVLSQPAKQACQ